MRETGRRWPDEPVQVTVPAWAKLNLWLLVGPKTRDGYHLLRSLVSPITLADSVRVWYKPGRSGSRTRPGQDLASRAVNWWRDHIGRIPGEVTVSVRKEIPVSAGLGGGSADAAAVLRALCRLSGTDPDEVLAGPLCELGCDVPVCLFGRPALVSGRGERLTRAPLPRWEAVCVLWPGIAVSTAQAFAWMDEAGACRRSLDWTPPLGHNDFWPVVSRHHPELETWRMRLLAAGAETVGMTGSGSALFGVYRRRAEARRAAEALETEAPAVWACSFIAGRQSSARDP